MEATMTKLNDIFNRLRILRIPFFQRAYVWEEEQWERFLEDMEYVSQNKKPYFFGSLILKQLPTEIDENVGDVRELIDGQQRLTTLIIFFKAIWLHDKSQKLGFLNDKFRLEQSTEKLALEHNHIDLESFERICDLNEAEEIDPDDVKKDKILGAYNFFREKFRENGVKKLNVSAILANVIFVSIGVWEKENEQQIFDTINSLGISLTVAELLKNYFFDRNEIDLYEQNWKEVFEKDDETKQYWDRAISVGRMPRTFIDLFFYAYLQIKKQERTLGVSKDDRDDFSRVENMFPSYKKMIKTYCPDKNAIIAEIKTYASIFRENFDYGVIEKSLPSTPGIERINAIIFRLEHSTLVPYTLFILKNLSDGDDRQNLFARIESYAMRRIVVKAITQNYNLLFSSMIRSRILSEAQFRDRIEKSEDNVNSLPSDHDLKEGFANSRLINKQAAGILYFIESKIGDPHDQQATRLRGISGYSLEHLMPKKWQKHWENPGTQEGIDERNERLLTLGNLAIIRPALNASIKNSDWKTKKAGTEKRKGLEFYASGLETMHKCLEVTDWNEREIEKRADWLCEKAIEIWPAK